MSWRCLRDGTGWKLWANRHVQLAGMICHPWKLLHGHRRRIFSCWRTHGSKALENCMDMKGNKGIFKLWDLFRDQNAAYSRGSYSGKKNRWSRKPNYRTSSISTELTCSAYWYFHSVFALSTTTVWRLGTTHSSLFLDRNFFLKKNFPQTQLVFWHWPMIFRQLQNLRVAEAGRDPAITSSNLLLKAGAATAACSGPRQSSKFFRYFRVSSRDGDLTASLGNLSQCLITLRVAPSSLLSQIIKSHLPFIPFHLPNTGDCFPGCVCFCVLLILGL